MTDTPKQTTTDNWLEEPKKRPEMVNVLTILTFVGSGIAIISAIYNFFNAEHAYQKLLDSRESFERMPDTFKKLVGPDPIEMARRSMENRIPLTLLSLVAAVLCIVGAIQMRKLLKQGFYVYLIGEILPYISYAIFIGSFGLPIIFSMIFGLVFIILYATQLKHLK